MQSATPRSRRESGTTGDGVLATFHGPARAVHCAVAIRDALHALALDMRAGLHTGEIELRDHDLSGLAVHIAARVAGTAAPSSIPMSRTVRADDVPAASLNRRVSCRHIKTAE